MHTIWHRNDRDRLLERLERLARDRPPRWGSMNALQMVQHLTNQFKLALGDLEVRPRRSRLGWPVVKTLVIYVMPWPRGAPTAPELLEFSTSDWQDAQRDLGAAMERIVSRGSGGTGGGFAPHPIFGDIGTRAWGVLMYRHVDHHLRQFGE